MLGHRYYDPEAGRFLSRDPAQDGRNRFVYCDNNPLAYIDDQGLGKVKIVIITTKKGADALYKIFRSRKAAKNYAKKNGRQAYHPGRPDVGDPDHYHDYGPGGDPGEHITWQHAVDKATDPQWNKHKMSNRNPVVIIPLGDWEEKQTWLDNLMNMFLNPIADVKDVVDMVGEAITPAVRGGNRGFNRLGRTRWLDADDALLL